MVNYINMKKYSMLYLCLFASLSLMSCSQDENMLSENNNDDKEFVVMVDFSVSGIADYGESNQPSTRSTVSPVKEVIPLNEDFEAEVTLTPDVPVQTRSAAPTPVDDGVLFRVLAYKGNTYAGHADYKIEGGTVKLVGTTGPLVLYNNTYKFIAYSYNRGDYLPIWRPEWTSTAPNLLINAEQHDFLHWTEEITLDQQQVKLPIVFSHLLPHFKIKLDTSEMLGLNCNSASATLKPFDTDVIPKSGTWNPLTHDNNNNNSFTPNGEDNITPTIEFSDEEILKSQEYVFSSKPKILFPISATGLTLTLKADFGYSQWNPNPESSHPTHTLNKDLQLGQHTFLSGRSYTCLVKIKPSNMNLISTSRPDNCIHIHNAITNNTSYYSFDISNEGSGTEDILGTALYGKNGMSPAKVVVLWQETDPESKIPLIPGVRYLKDERQIIMALNGGLEGNAIIAAVDAGGEVIWSWHFWVADNPKYFDGTIKAMNIGATKSNPTGLLFQYGRKDPLRKNKILILDRGSVSAADANKLGIKNPMHFITNWDWTSNFWTGGQTYKYNPCPAGTRIPSFEELTTKDYKPSNGEFGFIEGNGSFNDGEGGYWTNDPGKFFVPSSTTEPKTVDRAAAYPIRCIRDNE